ncbi:Ubiquitin carboxyl-terminal hydrolase 31 [Bulinus truncatus]|nr:Ubiquitin carboxyl-terminal hydrolase 31 [Bulinus truncatus]
MSQVIPGGRPRASSDGDILDEGLCGSLFVNLNDRHNDNNRKFYNKVLHENTNNGNGSSNCLDLSNDAFDSDGEVSSQSQSSFGTSRRIKFLKSMRKAVSRAFVKDNSSPKNESTLKKVDKHRVNNLSKIWTPDLRHLTEQSNGRALSTDENLDSGTISSARPLITDLSIGMTAPRWKVTPGTIGIINHKSSCFMNAVLQCLSNTDSFTEYFVKDFFKNDLKNSKNGKKGVFQTNHGEVTEQLAKLLKSLWTGKYSDEISKEFKSVVGKVNAQYKGDHQHDAQEFLLWLLDRIHEDVSVYTKKKSKSPKGLRDPSSYSKGPVVQWALKESSTNSIAPVVQWALKESSTNSIAPVVQWALKESSTNSTAPVVQWALKESSTNSTAHVLPVGRTDEELAAEAASVNGESFVLKLFQALHSSTLICATCGERSSTFDPYLCVSLPLPQRCPRLINIFFVPLKVQHYRVIKYALILNQFDSVKDLRDRIAAETKLNASQLLLVQMKEDGFGSTYFDEQPLSDFGDIDTLYAIETYSLETSMNSSTLEFETPMAQILVSHVELSGGSGRSCRFSSPAVIKVRRDITWKDLQKEILLAMEDSIYKEIFGQKLSSLFKLRLYDGSSQKIYLPTDVEMPLYTQIVERAYTELVNEFEQPHIKFVAEWDSNTKKSVVRDDKEHIESHSSVMETQSNLPTQGKVTLEECFKLYTQEERLVGEDAWLCPHCKQQQQGTIKTLGLWSLPDILVLHLKRFKQSGQRRSKLMTLVEFPVDNLDMSGHLSHRMTHGAPLRRDEYMYDLLGVSNHYGNMMGGHYTAYCRSPVDGVWREFNDNTVINLKGPIPTKEAYLLFYQRKSLTKDINQKMFTGDHWVFSLTLSLAPSLEVESYAPNEGVPKNSDGLNHTKRSRSRSASPSSHKQNREASAVSNSQISRPLTPQPSRHAVVKVSNGLDIHDQSSPDSPQSPPSSALLSRKSRPVQRQVSEPHFKRESSAGAISSNTYKKDIKKNRPLLGRRSVEDDISATDYNRNKMDYSNGFTGQKRTFVNIKPKVIRHEKSSTLPINLSRNNGYQAVESDSKYPNSDYSSYSDSLFLSSSLESPSILRVRLEDTENLSSRYPESEDARRKLAQLITHSLPRPADERTLPSIDTIEEDKISGRISKKFNPHKRNLKDVTHLMNNDLLSRLDYPSSDLRDDDKDYRRNKDSFPFTYYDNDDNFKSSRTGIGQQSRLSNQKKFQALAKQHFGSDHEPLAYDKERYRTRFADDTTYRDSDDFEGRYNYDSHKIKYATIGRMPDISERGRLEKDAIPRSSTDYSIQYNLLNIAQPPPSPTPPHTLREEKTISSSGLSSHPSSTSDFFPSHLSDREMNSLSSYEYHGRSRFDQKPIYHGSRALTLNQENKNRFRPPRGVWGVKSKPPSPQVGGGLPTPCLRESSV